MNKVSISTMKGLAQAKLNGDAEIELLQHGVKFMIRCAADSGWLNGKGYDHVDWQYKTKADYDKHRAIAGRSWNFLPAVLRFNGLAFAVAIHSFNHSIRVAANAYDIVSPVVTRATEKDKNGNWVPGHHHCMWTGDTYKLRGNRTASYDVGGRNAVNLAERLSGAVEAPQPTPTPQPVAVNYVVVVNGNNLNVRTGPGTNNAAVGQVGKMQGFRIVAESLGVGANLWGRICPDDKKYPDKWIALDFTVKDSFEPQPKPPNGDTYTVKPGDVLSIIARDLGVPLSELVALNCITNPDRIYVGQVLKVPKK